MARSVTGPALVASLASSPLPATAASDLFLKLGDIRGESRDAKHSGEIELLSWSWSLHPAVLRGSQKPSDSQKARQCLSGMSLQKRLDSTTPSILEAGANGTVFRSAILSMRRQGGTQPEYFKIVLTDVFVSADNTRSAAGTDDAQLEDVVLAFSAATLTFTPDSAAGGDAAPITKSVPGSC